jgi:hypothetical protein
MFCKIPKLGAFFPFKNHSHGKKCEIVALNYSLGQNILKFFEITPRNVTGE